MLASGSNASKSERPQVQRAPLPFHEPTDAERDMIDAIAPFTMTSPERQWALLKAVQYIDGRSIPGDIVECGVWRGGNIMLAKLARKKNFIARRYFLFDTFRGMSPPAAIDIDYKGEPGAVEFGRNQREDHNDWCYASREEVERNLSSVGFAEGELVFREGRVEDTLRVAANLPDRIAILRLDTDWYESTRIELEVLYPRLSIGGVLIVDDYGHWRGARRAVDEFFGEAPPLLVAVDSTGRVVIKNRERSLVTVADLLGFSTLGAFSRWFRTRFGCSVTAWRAKHGTRGM